MYKKSILFTQSNVAIPRILSFMIYPVLGYSLAGKNIKAPGE